MLATIGSAGVIAAVAAGTAVMVFLFIKFVQAPPKLNS